VVPGRARTLPGRPDPERVSRLGDGRLALGVRPQQAELGRAAQGPGRSVPRAPRRPAAAPEPDRLPRWLQPANRVIVLLQRLGLAFFTFHLLSVPGRTTGKLRTTPVSPLRVGDQLYLVSIGQTGWVKNARAAGWGILARGRRHRPLAPSNRQRRELRAYT
jgi:hypothetical protein